MLFRSLVWVKVVHEKVRAKPAERRMEGFDPLLEQLHDRRVEADGHGAGDLDDEASVPRPSIQAAPQPKPAIPNRSSRSVNGHSSSSRNGSADRAT